MYVSIANETRESNKVDRYLFCLLVFFHIRKNKNKITRNE